MDKEPQIISMGRIDISESGKFAAPRLDSLPILATRNLVLFPEVAIPVALVRESALAVATMARDTKTTIGLCCQTDPDKESPHCAADVAQYGVFVQVLDIFDLPDGSKSAFIRSTGKFRVKGDAAAPLAATPYFSLIVARSSEKKESDPDSNKVLKDLIMSVLKEFCETANVPHLKYELFSSIDSFSLLVNTLCTQLPFELSDKMEFLRASSVETRAHRLFHNLQIELAKLNVIRKIMETTNAELSQDQREAFMRRQIDVMQRELYGDVDDVEQLNARAAEIELPDYVSAAFEKGLSQMRRINPSVPDYSVIYNYLTTILDLPWNTASPLSTSFPEAKEILDSGHYGMEKVKQRVIEQVAVTMARPDNKAPILCLVGAPGVGKTSLGESVAKALGRKYQRISLGGVSDEAEIRGHRRTYIGAMPGRFIDAIRKAGTSNPVILLDEIDKLSKDIKGDPGAALLEVLDPEQNCHFHDNFIDLDFDLSKVLFIATANSLDTVPRPLLDRMEVVEVPGYLLEEKIEIAQRHLTNRVEQAAGLPEHSLSFSPEAITHIIEGYTSESGVRQLEKQMASIARKLLVKKMTGENPTLAVTTKEQVEELLGVVRFTPQRYETLSVPGVVTGLAWTQHGGEILFIESSLSEGKGEKLTLTGNLGDVMKESATIALQYVKAHAAEIGIELSKFTENNLHIHVPEGAVPKDGPSAGITMAVSIASTFTGRMVRPRLAMTGEITLRGKVMPVGGIKEKILAARRAGITDIIICEENRKDIAEIEQRYISGIAFHYVTTVDQVLAIALQ